ncbi:MAG: competence/damage-inducible protein A [Promethearchaeota archaeon]
MTLRVELLIIGNEILSGHTLDTNSQWLAQRLLELDLPVRQIVVIEDRVELIVKAIKASFERKTTLLITTGGLGPTFDDVTAEGLAHSINAPLKLHTRALQMVKKRYQELKAQKLVESSEITPAREKMARLPSGAEPLSNSVGTAPGIHLQVKNSHIYCLPGVPQELYAIFMEGVAPQLASFAEKVVVHDLIHVPILDESVLAPLIDSLMQDTQGVYLKSLPRPYQSRQPLRVAITATKSTRAQAEQLLSRTIDKLKKISYAHRQLEPKLDE